MYLTAHRVVSPSTGEQGINAFYRLHGDEWRGLDEDPESVPSRLVRSRRLVTTKGNRIRSYLDVIAPDASSPGEVLSSFHEFLGAPSPSAFPCDTVLRGVRFRVGVERSLAASWRAEAQRLFNECLQVWIGQETTTG